MQTLLVRVYRLQVHQEEGTVRQWYHDPVHRGLGDGLAVPESRYLTRMDCFETERLLGLGALRDRADDLEDVSSALVGLGNCFTFTRMIDREPGRSKRI